MTAPNSADIDRDIRSELDRVLEIGSLVEQTPDHHAEPNSDLADDEGRFPDIWAATLARRGIVYAVENVEAACTLILNGQWTTPQFALLRAAYESAGAAVWLLVPENVNTRLARLVWQHRESWRYSEKAYSGTPLDDGGEHQERQQWATEAAQKLGISLAAGSPRGFENLIASIDDLPGHPESLLTAWRICSGVSHAKTWALTTVTTEVDSMFMYEHGRMSARVPNAGLFLTDLRIARRVVQQAWCLYRIRTTSRPHGMTLRLEPRDREGNVVPPG
ncbi:hypothetical protein [Mycolicibacterium rhodesiae]|uniref:Uncharacterized protein n=1 Tax=Mycolicibacterium rhodesiae TaxID=36814 RepID=A0A1X0IU53_MYCRH|nr:hypothetical protein [Mycolicibacterium rhodesiae]MCV7346079.1 hypothetical protein [Mycolicibacterium rhodesiae]ORB52368.1 hypothetical protein BST42_15570 [Mycolicibacterium rhodesiae]